MDSICYNSLENHPMQALYRNLPEKCLNDFTFKYDLFFMDEMSVEDLFKLKKSKIDFNPATYYCDQDADVNTKVDIYVNYMQAIYEEIDEKKYKKNNNDINRNDTNKNEENKNNEINNNEDIIKVIDKFIHNLNGCLYIYKQTVMALTEAWILSCQTKSNKDSVTLIRTLLSIFNAISPTLVIVKEVVLIDECPDDPQQMTYEYSYVYNFMPAFNILLRYKIFIEHTYKYVLPIVDKLSSNNEFFNNVTLSYAKHASNELIVIYQHFSPTTRHLNPISPPELEQILNIIERFLVQYNACEPCQLHIELFLNLKSINMKFFNLFFQYMELESSIPFQTIYIEHLKKILSSLICCYDYIFRFEIFKCLSTYMQNWKHTQCPSSYVWFCKFVDIFNEIIDRFILHDSRKICKITFYVISAISHTSSEELERFIDKFSEILPNVKRSFVQLNCYEPIDYFRYYTLNDPDVLENPLKYRIMHDLLM